MHRAWIRFCDWSVWAAARAIQRHVAAGNRQREFRAWARRGLWTRLQARGIDWAGGSREITLPDSNKPG